MQEKQKRIKLIKQALQEIGLKTRAVNVKYINEIELTITEGNKSEKFIQEKLYRKGLIKDRENAGINPQGNIVIY